MKFSKLSSYFIKLEKTASRITMTEILAELLGEASVDEVDKIVYLVLGELVPSFKGVVFNIAERMMLQVIMEAYGVDLEEVKSEYRERGDIGDVAEFFAKELDKKRKN